MLQRALSLVKWLMFLYILLCVVYRVYNNFLSCFLLHSIFSVLPGSSGGSSGWTSILGSSSEADSFPMPVPPANPVASGEAEAGPSHVVPFPYDENEVIGGDSVLSIQRRLLAKYEFPSADEIKRARIKAEDLMEVKVEIVRIMAPLDPDGDWDRQGARALDNPRRATGEESLDKLVKVLDRIKRNDEGTIEELKSKMIGRIRRDEDAGSSA